MNPHNKQGTPVNVNAGQMTKLYNNEHFHSLMDWVEGSLRITKKIMSPEFFHPSFSKNERDIIVSIIYSCYDVVVNIEPLGKNGVIITCSDVLTMTKLP